MFLLAVWDRGCVRLPFLTTPSQFPLMVKILLHDSQFMTRFKFHTIPLFLYHQLIMVLCIVIVLFPLELQYNYTFMYTNACTTSSLTMWEMESRKKEVGILIQISEVMERWVPGWVHDFRSQSCQVWLMYLDIFMHSSSKIGHLHCLQSKSIPKPQIDFAFSFDLLSVF